MMALMQEMISVYPLLNPPVLEYHQATRVCNALAMLQCIASHPDIRLPFLKSQFPLFLYPFLATQNPNKSFDHLRLTSLGVIGALVKSDNSEVIQILLTTEIVPLCLKVMINGSELAKTVAIFIIQKIVTDNYGLEYACEFNGRFKEILHTLAIMIQQLQEGASLRILKHVIKCYLRLSEHPAARKVLREVLPEALRDATFSHILKDDAMAKRWLAHLLANLSDNLVQGN
jgi:CCR4-NOT transcription complex subunit 9